MSRFTVDESKCRRDGICVAVCPVGILTYGEGAPPAQAPGAEELCIGCGHCVAACPYGACALDTMPVEACPPVRPEWRLGPEQAEHFLRSRRSIRVYRETTVEPGRLERLIRVARYAPDGTPDASFGSAGVMDSTAPLTPSGVAILPDERIVVLAAQVTSASYAVQLARLWL